MKTHITLALLLLSFGSVSWADMMDSLTTERIYAATLEACRGLTAQEIRNSHIKIDDYIVGRTSSADFNRILLDVQRESFHSASSDMNFTEALPPTEFIMGNPGFRDALFACYGDDQKAHRFFRRLVMMSDRRGKVFEGAKIAGLALISSTGYGLAMKPVQAFSGALAKAIQYVFAAGATASIGWNQVRSLLNERKLRREIEDRCASGSDGYSSCESKVLIEGLEGHLKGRKEAPPESPQEFFRKHEEAAIAALEIQLKNSTTPAEADKIRMKIEAKRQFIKNLGDQ